MERPSSTKETNSGVWEICSTILATQLNMLSVKVLLTKTKYAFMVSELLKPAIVAILSSLIAYSSSSQGVVMVDMLV